MIFSGTIFFGMMFLGMAVLGMSLSTYTTVHVIISLVGIASGLVVLFGMMAGKRLDGITALFLTTTVLTSVTGFGFPFEKLLPSHILGIISLCALAICLVARYPRQMSGGWRRTYVITATMALYFNCFVLVVQSFLKVDALKALAPTQKEPPFAIAQGILLLAFIVAGIYAAKGFKQDIVLASNRRAA